MPKQISAELRRKATKAGLERKTSMAKTAAKFGISEASLWRWVKEAQGQVSKAPATDREDFTQAKVQGLIQANDLLVEENSILRKAVRTFTNGVLA